jgi:hypothetical protein
MSAFVLISFVGLIAPDATRSKELSESALKAAAVKQFDRAESSHVVVYAGWMGARAKPIAEAAEKAFEFAAKAIKVEKPDELFPGKIVVVMLPDRRQFGSFCLAITGKKPDSRESQEIRTRTEPPFAAISQPLGEKLAPIRDRSTSRIGPSWASASCAPSRPKTMARSLPHIERNRSR